MSPIARANPWLRPEAYPIFACIFTGFGLVGYIGYQHTVKHNDVVVNKAKPRQTFTEKGNYNVFGLNLDNHENAKYSNSRQN